MDSFPYREAFDRNIGWLTAAEQESLRARRVAVAGMGGVGGGHLIALVRLGVGAFSIADLDHFDIANFNRQAGAFVSTLGKPKVDVMAAMARDINPALRLRVFDGGVTAENVDAFLDGADLFVDGFDFFAMDIRRRVFARARELGIPAVTAAPIGMGVGLLAFMPDGMSFEEYFRLEGQRPEEQYLRFLMGVAPRGLHRSYLADATRVDLANHRGPSTGAACLLCSGAVAAMATRILLLRGGVAAAPVHHHYDAYRQVFARTLLRRGNGGAVQRMKLAVARRQFARMLQSRPVPPPATEPIDAILDAARWAPSGDNVQPWRFEKLGPESVRIRFIMADETNPYEYRGGEPTLLSIGMLLEAIGIAASAHGRHAHWTLDHDGRSSTVSFAADARAEPDPLYAVLPLRSVDRRPFRRSALLPRERLALEAALGSDLDLRWHEGDRARIAFARLGAQATRLRLRMPEAMPVHRAAIDWRRGDSMTGIPAAATGLSPMTLPVMRWAIRSPRRMSMVNAAGGAHSAAWQLDWRSAMGSAAFFSIGFRDRGPHDTSALLRAGGAILRMWLAATRIGLVMQPGLAMLAFASYGESGAAFTASRTLREEARAVSRRFSRATGRSAQETIFLGRIGRPRHPPLRVRSIRRSLAELMDG